jgi:hypothetical protein
MQPADRSLAAGVQALPPELQQELLLVLASRQLLDSATCALLTSSSGAGSDSSGHDGSSSQPAESLLAGLVSLTLTGCVLLSSASLHRLLCCPLPQLQALSLKGLPWLTDADVWLAVQRCPNLRRLDLSGCPQLTGAAVQAVTAAAAAPQLQSLSLSGCWQVSALPGLAGCTQLTSLALAGCWQLNEAAVHQVGAARSWVLQWLAAWLDGWLAGAAHWCMGSWLECSEMVACPRCCWYATHNLLQVLAGTPLLEELTLSGCSQLGSGVLVSASLPARLPPAALGEFEAGLLLEHRGPHHLEGVQESREEAAEKLRFPIKGVTLPQVGWL